MVEVKYVCSEMQLSTKQQKVRVEFRRVPTQEQLEKWQARQKDSPSHVSPSIKQSLFGMVAVLEMMGDSDHELELNFDKVIMVLSLQEVLEAKIAIGMLVQLNMPEQVRDIIKVEQ